MLLLVRDHKIDEDVAQWAVSALFEGVTSFAPTAVIAADALETDQAARSGRPVVLSLRTDEPAVRLEAAAASAAAVIWIAPTSGAGVRSRLRLDAVGRWAIPVTVVTLSDSPPDTKDAAGGGIKVVWVSPVSGPKPHKPARAQ